MSDVVDPVLKPRIEEVPPGCEDAVARFRETLVWDNLLPWLLGNSAAIDAILPRYHRVGVDFVSLTVPDRSPEEARQGIASVHAQVAERGDWLAIATSVADVEDARDAGKLAVGINFQETLPFGRDLGLIREFYNLGVRQALLAYNNRNLVGDGCAEPDDAGLSLFGREVVREMNAVGMFVDGSHSGYRTTMEAMELGEAPFVFSHSNPFGVRPHYRNIRDDQIRACAATGGVIGINGVGYWCGDDDASTEAIFACLDYTVQLVGPDHVGLGFDYIYDLDDLIAWVRADPIAWPPYEGEWMRRHNYAGPEQMVELVKVMTEHGYPDDAVVGILGGNWAALARKVWK
jgi:membrane dipeptidase